MIDRVATFVRRAFFPLGILFSAVAVLLVGVGLDPVVGIRGAYAVLGLVLGAIVYYGYDTATAYTTSEHLNRWAAKVVYLIVLAVLSVAAVTETRLLALVTLLPVGYLLLALQLRADHTPRRVLPQIASLFAVAPVTKYLTAGFYFGDGDIIFHVLHVEQVLARGTVAAIQGPVDQYRIFPGLHLFTGSVRLFTDLSAYDALVGSGILTYALFVVPLMYLLGLAVFRRVDLAVFVALGATVVYSISFHASYFFPQSLAIPLLLFFLFILLRTPVSGEAYKMEWMTVAVLLLVGTLFTHHLSFILVTPVVLVLGGSTLLFSTFDIRVIDRISASRFRFLPIVAGWIAAVTYWTVSLESFIFNVTWWFDKILIELFNPTSPSQSAASTVTLGTTMPEQTVQTAIYNLASANSLYLIALVAVFALGLRSILEHYERVDHSTTLIVLGTVGAVVIFKTPLLLPGLTRIRMPFAFLFALVVGVGLHRSVRSSVDSSVASVVPIALMLLLATTAPLYVQAGDDLYDIHDPPNGPPQKQVAFSETEYRSLAEVTGFAERTGADVQTLWIDGLAMERFGSDAVASPSVSPSGIRVDDGLLLYRRGWADHLVHYSGDSFGTVIFSEEWLTRNVRRENKVYDSGPSGMLWADTTMNLSNPRTATESAGG